MNFFFKSRAKFVVVGDFTGFSGFTFSLALRSASGSSWQRCAVDALVPLYRGPVKALLRAR